MISAYPVTGTTRQAYAVGSSEVLLQQWQGSFPIDYTIPENYWVTRAVVMYAEDSGGDLTAYYADSSSAQMANQYGYHGMHPDGSTVTGYPVSGKRVTRVTGRVYSYGGKYNSYGVVYLYAVSAQWS